MRFTRLAAIVVLLMGANVLAQNSRAVLTGVVYDTEGIGTKDVSITAENSGTKIKYQTKTTSTGNFAFAELPVGDYVISISAKGFKPYISPNLTLSATQVRRFDIALEAEKKAAQEGEEEEEEGEEYYIDVMSRVDSSQWAQTVSAETLKSLPLLGFDSGDGRIRNPLLALQLTPGSLMAGQQYFRINGAPNNTESIRIEGQDASNGILLSSTIATQAGVDAIEEFSIQANNYTAEYGPAGGGIANIAMKSGTNAYHGSLYSYVANEVLNEPYPFTDSKPEDRRYDYGATLGGPLSIPRVYDGRDKTFMFLNFEQLRQKVEYEKAFTVPTLAFRQGDFRQTLTGRVLGTDSIGRSILEGAIYDPATERVVNGNRIRNTFPSNIIPRTRFDAVSRLIQAYIPLPTDTNNTHVTDNYVVPWKSPRLDSIGSFKLDHDFGKSKLSFYYGINVSDSSQSTEYGGDGIARAITGGEDIYVRAQTYRLSYDRTLSPTRTLHIGLGYQGLKWIQDPIYSDFDANAELGLAGANLSYFPYISDISTVRGGAKEMGSRTLGLSKMEKPTANASMTWIHGKHIFKFGAELRIEGYPSVADYPAYGSLNFSAEQTTLPSTYGQNLGGTTGFPYASFLLGLVDSGDIGFVSQPRLGKNGWAFYVQDSWKVTHKLTFEYGLRYDYQTYLRDGLGRMPNFSPTALNPAAGNLPGAMVYEGSGDGHCNCDFASVYGKAFGPRMGVAYQLGGKNVLRAGWGVIYGQTATDNGSTLLSASTNPFFATTYASAAMKLSDGFPSAAAWPNPNINETYIGSGISPIAIHPDAGRPPRQIQWSVSIQRQLPLKLVMDLGYVHNHGSSWETNGLANLNALTESRLEDLGLDITDSDDRTLLLSPLNSSLASQNGYTAPYPGFPTTETVAQSLRPFPQYGDILYRWAPLGKTWYDSVQVTMTRQYSDGVAFTGGFSWQKAKAIGDEGHGDIIALDSLIDDSYVESHKHTSSLSRTYSAYFAPSYTLPRFSGNKYVSMAFSDWRLSAMLQYASGLPVHVPESNSNLYLLLFQNTYANKAKTGSYYLRKLNSSNVDPLSEFVLDPSAWADPAEGEFSTSKTFYSDYRFKRHPLEQISLGRTFPLNDKLRLHARIEVENIFNRKDVSDPYYINAKAKQISDSDDVPQSGFGYISYRVPGSNPRNGQILVKLEF